MAVMLGSRHQKGGGGNGGFSRQWVSFFCISSFILGVLVVNRFWDVPQQVDVEEDALDFQSHQKRELEQTTDCNKKDASIQEGDIINQVSLTYDVIMNLDKTISTLEMQLASARAAKEGNQEGSPVITKPGTEHSKNREKVFYVMGIMTAFSSRKRRDSIRSTWMPKGENLKKLEKEKGIVMRFVIGHSETPGGVLDRLIDAEEKQHKDFLKLNHVEGYHELSTKTQTYFTTVVALWDADFYIKVDDDVHINPVLAWISFSKYPLYCRGVKYHEPEHWKFGEEGNKYFRHATGQLYVISKDLATYISVNRHILHRYANEDVSLGSWFIGLDVEHINDQTLCCGTAPDCEWKAQAGNPCAASFDWSCSGICKSVERMKEVHERCGEGDGAVWQSNF
ncbi:hypothetical protein MKX01_036947 [Papaver californicum]|nr:hypothetical protein MKX01_036947 [Papaver californicum]